MKASVQGIRVGLLNQRADFILGSGVRVKRLATVHESHEPSARITTALPYFHNGYAFHDHSP